MIAAELRSQLLALDDADRAEAAGWLIDLMDTANPGQAGMDSAREAALRLDELESGSVAGVSLEEFSRNLRHG